MGLLSGSSSTKRESHILKLVHPGGFIELHTDPIMAFEVMKKNPRHCVTRPDIFRFPWIVVSPESILTPGNVFFIVPCHTIRHLLKSAHANTNTNTSNSSTLIKHHRDRFLRKHTKNEPFADQEYRHGHSHRHSNKAQCFKKQSSGSQTCREGHKQRNGGNYRAQSFVTEERHVYHHYSSEYNSREAGNPTPVGIGLRHSGQIQIPNKLKPCLKKDKSHDARSRKNLKVRFACTDQDDLNGQNFKNL